MLGVILCFGANALVWAFVLGMRTADNQLSSVGTMLIVANLLIALARRTHFIAPASGPP